MDVLNSTIFAKIQGNSVVEYPVSAQHIINRAEPFEWYATVVYDAKPHVPEFHYAEEIPVVDNNRVRIKYEVKPYTLSELLRLVNPISPLLTTEQQPIDISELSESTVARIKELTINHVQSKLDAFAQAKGYDSLLSATSYKDSTVVQFSTEATIAIQLRDQVWGALYTYFDAVTAGSNPVPFTVEEIESHLPDFIWPQ